MMYEKLKEATPEELLEAAIRFYSGAGTRPDLVRRFMRIGFALAQPGGWRNVAPAWLEKRDE